MKESLWTGGFALAVLLLFFVFVANGWPGDMDSCISDNDAKKPSVTDNGCYCEPFVLKDVQGHKPGVRQPFNTFSNLYALASGAFLAYAAWKKRKEREKNSHIPTTDGNRFRRTDFYPIFYIQVAVFLGLGSMFFHASLVWWGGIFDQMSMYTLIAFMNAYTMERWRHKGEGWEWHEYYTFPVCYVILLIIMFIAALLHASSQLMIAIMLVPYFVLEIIIWVRSWYNEPGRPSFWVYWRYWFIGVFFFVIAAIVRAKSETGEPLCISCSSAFQYHGLWHILCGVMAVMLYYHWQKAKH